MPSRHAFLAPSASKRWMTCTPSAKAESVYPEQESSFAKEGTIAHSTAEAMLHRYLESKAETTLELEEFISDWTLANDAEELKPLAAEAQKEGFCFDDILLNVFDGYVNPVYESYLEAKKQDEDAVLLIEATLKLDTYIPECFGSSDSVIIYNDVLRINDLKYGMGVKVDAPHNSQMMCYALGAVLGPGELYNINHIVMTIYQPRLNHVSAAELSWNELHAWAKHILAPAAERAFKGVGEYVPGDHCQFCKAAPRCRAALIRAKMVAALAEDPAMLSDEEVSLALNDAKSISNWCGKIQQYATDRISSGQGLPGWKLVEGRSTRRWSDTTAVTDTLINAGFDYKDISDVKLKGIPDMEKLLRKEAFNSLLGNFVVKAPGKPSLVPADDPRPAIETAEQAFKDIKPTV